MSAYPIAGPLGLAALLLATAAVATPWQWRDASGRMVYSDRPPPSDVRASQIVRQPESSIPRQDGDTAARDASAAGAGTAGSASPSWVEREAAFRKRKLEREAAEASARDARESLESSRRACEDLRVAMRTLQSGLRVVTVDANGNPTTIDEAERARRLEAARRDLARNCTAS